MNALLFTRNRYFAMSTHTNSSITDARPDDSHLHDRPPFFCRLPLEVLTISGAESVKFLQGQLTVDVAALAPGTATLAACCNPQGRIRALFTLFAGTGFAGTGFAGSGAEGQPQFHLLLPAGVLTGLLETLKKYAAFFRTVRLQDDSANWQVLGVVGPAPAGALTHQPAGMPAEARLCLLPAASAASVPAQLAGFAEQPAESWARLEILAGRATVGPELVEKLLPHHIDLPAQGGVSFSKGCYTGQEIIARMQYRGTVKTHLQRGRIASTLPVAAGTAVLAGDQNVGEIVRSAPSGDGGQLVLLTLQDSALGQTLQIADGDRPILQLHTDNRSAD